jgi:hypothetical protein
MNGDAEPQGPALLGGLSDEVVVQDQPAQAGEYETHRYQRFAAGDPLQPLRGAAGTGTRQVVERPGSCLKLGPFARA